MTISTPTKLGHATGGAVSACVSISVTTLADIHAGDLIFVNAVENHNYGLSVVDSGGNTYVPGLKVSGASVMQPFWAFAAADMPAGSTITLNVTGSNLIAMSCFTVPGATALDVQGAGATGNSVSPLIGATPTGAGIAMAALDITSGHNDGIYVEGAGFTSLDESFAGNVDLRMAFMLTTPGAISYAPTLPRSRSWQTNLVAFH